MNTLRTKLVLLLAVVIISVVGVLTGVMLYIFRPPGEQHVGPVAEQVQMLERIAKSAPSSVPLFNTPADGQPRQAMTRWLQQELDRRSANLNVQITRRNEREPLMVSIPVNGSWVQWPLPDLPPPDGGWRVLFSWLALITLGALAIAVFVANRMIQPLVLLEKAIGSVAPDGTLPELPVKGPAEVKVAAKALNSLSWRLKDAMESRMRLVAAAGHDMRTPITRMRLRAEFVTDDDDRTMWLKDIDELERIADSAILLVREESGASKSETLRLDELLAGVVEELRGLDFNIELQGTASAEVHANRLALNRALRNLIINAATHGVSARVRMERGEDSARIVIEDDGPGIPSELLGQVFEPFFRADPARRQNIPGAGLGLTIAREIIRKAGGDIRILNGELRGLKQIVELPVSHETDL